MQSISKLATAGGLLRATLTHKPLKLSPISSILSTSYPANNKCSSPLAISRVRTFGGTRACNATINNTSSPGSSEAPQAPEPQNVICGVHLEEGLELTEYMMIAEKITLVLQSVVEGEDAFAETWKGLVEVHRSGVQFNPSPVMHYALHRVLLQVDDRTPPRKAMVLVKVPEEEGKLDCSKEEFLSMLSVVEGVSSSVERLASDTLPGWWTYDCR